MTLQQVVQDQLEDLGERGVIYVSAGKPLEIARKRWHEVGPKSPHA